MLFRSRLRTGARKEISLGGRSSTLLVVLTLIALVTKLVTDLLYVVVDPRVQFGAVAR